MRVVRRAGGISALALAAGLLWAGAANGGYTWPRGVAKPTLGGHTPIGYGPKTDDLDKTYEAFVAAGKATDTKDAAAKVDKLQDAAIKAISMVTKHDRTIGERLRTMLRSGRLDIDFQRSGPDDAAGSQVVVQDANGVATNAINVHLAVLEQANGGASLRDTISLALTLYHEGIHAGQETPALTETDEKRTTAERRRNHCKREIEAHDADIKLAADLRAAIKSLEANPNFQPAADADPLVKDVIAKLRDDRGKIEGVLKELETQEVSSTFARNRYQTACAAYQDFLDKKITYEDLKKKIGELPSGPSEVFAPLRRLVFVPVPTIGLLSEILDGRQTLIETPLDTILGLDQLPGRGMLLVSGLFRGHGAVIGYRDANEDGVYEPGAFFVAVQPTPLLTGGLELVDRPGTDEVLVHDGPSGALYPLLDTNENGLPDTLGPNAAADTPIPPDFVRILLAPDGTAFGFEGIAGTDDLFTTDEPTLRLRDVDGDGRYDRTQLRTFGERLGLEPIVLGPLSVGDTTAVVHSSAGSSLEVLAVDRATGYVDDLLATVSGAPSLAVRTIPLARPLRAGEGLVVHDVTDDVIGQATLVSSPGPDVHVVEAPVVDPVGAGGTADFRILVTNDGRAIATGVTVAAAIPPVVAWSVDDPGCAIDGGALVCTIGDLEPAESRVVHLTAPLHGDDCGGTLFTIVGASATNESPLDAGDDEDAATISIDCD